MICQLRCAAAALVVDRFAGTQVVPANPKLQ
jgi:hypothetical protein